MWYGQPSEVQFTREGVVAEPKLLEFWVPDQCILLINGVLYSRKFSDGNIFGQSRISTVRTDYIFVQCCMLNTRVSLQYACIVYIISHEQILVRN